MDILHQKSCDKEENEERRRLPLWCILSPQIWACSGVENAVGWPSRGSIEKLSQMVGGASVTAFDHYKRALPVFGEVDHSGAQRLLHFDCVGYPSPSSGNADLPGDADLHYLAIE